MRVVIFANGDLPELNAAQALLRDGDHLVAADGGARHMLAMEIMPQIVIGDLDSVDEKMLSELVARDVVVKRYPEEKDETDLELALEYALEQEASSILVLAALGDRLDQTLANLMLLTYSKLSGIDVRLDDGIEEAFFCHSQVEVHGRSGDIVSLIPWGQPVEGVNTKGLQWSLEDETLYPDRSRGISNVMLAEHATITTRTGLLLVIHRRQWVSSLWRLE
jgi:thiamine pyrophosphokinase